MEQLANFPTILFKIAFISAWQNVLIVHGGGSVFAPRELVVTASKGHPVVANPHDLVLVVDDAGSHLGAGVLGPHGREEGYGHEVVCPT